MSKCKSFLKFDNCGFTIVSNSSDLSLFGISSFKITRSDNNIFADLPVNLLLKLNLGSSS